MEVKKKDYMSMTGRKESIYLQQSTKRSSNLSIRKVLKSQRNAFDYLHISVIDFKA